MGLFAAEFYQSASFKALVIIPKITGALSIVGSSLIIRDVLRKKNRQRKLKATTNRIVSLMSICDVTYTFFRDFLGTWLVPKETGAWWAAGNQTTCTFQSFVDRWFSLAATGLNATLAVAFVLVVRYGWKDNRLQTYFMSFILLGLPVLLSLGLNFWPLIDQAFNWNGGWTCYIAPYPFYCSFTEAPCERGIQAPEIDMANVIWIQVCFALILVSTVTLFWTVLRKEKATDRYAVNENQRNRKQSKRVAMQGIWYAGSFFLTYICWWIFTVFQYVTSRRAPYWLFIMMAILVPLQGFFNCIVYFRPRFVNKKKRNNHNLGSRLRQASLARRAKAADGGISAATMNRRSGDVPSLAGAAGNKTVQFKDEEEKMEETAPIANEEPDFFVLHGTHQV